MAYVEKRIFKGKPYYYLKESKRVGGRVKTQTVSYLGTNPEVAKAREVAADFGFINFGVIRNWFANVYNVMILAQIILTAYGIYKTGLPLLWQALVAVGVAVAVDLLIKHLKKEVTARKSSAFSAPRQALLGSGFPKSAIITGLIITNVLAANQLWVVAAFAAAAMILKHIIRLNNKHIFNPANLALATFVFLLPASHGWSGATSIPLVIILGLATIFVLKRLHLPAIFFGTTLVLLLATRGLAGWEQFAANGAMWFFGLFMLTEPVTSPISRNGQLVFGFLAAIFAFAISFGLPQFALPIALVAADVLVPIIDRYVN